MAKIPQLTRYGRTGITVSRLCIGTSSWDHVTTAGGVAVLRAASTLGINLVDTSNIYAGGHSEKLVGSALATADLAGQFVVQTKLDRNENTGEFGYSQMFTSVHESLERLGVDHVRVLMLHDPEHIGFEAAMKGGGPVDALIDMREQGIADYIGISGGPVDMLQRFVETDTFDALVTHNRLNLLDQSASALLNAATKRDMGVSNAAPFGAGILTGDKRFAGTFAYAPISAEREAAFVRLVHVCADLHISIGAAALQFSLRDPRVHTTLVGITRTDRLQEVVSWANTLITDDDWSSILDAVPAVSAR
jgi:D-threo-aldose 1-dehydrogenase